MGSPFSPHDRRMKFYLICSIFSAFLLTIFTLNSETIVKISNSYNAEMISNIQWKSAIGVAFLTIYILYAIFSVAYAYRLNTRPGFSAGIRGAFIRNHLLYVLAYVLTWAPYMGMCFFIMYSSKSLLDLETITPQTSKITAAIDDYVKRISVWYYITIFTSMMTGVLMSSIRIREPIFQRQFGIYWN
jgi:hypothetical protein